MLKPNQKHRWVIAMIDCKINHNILNDYVTLLSGEWSYEDIYHVCKSHDFLKWYFGENAFFSFARECTRWSRFTWLENYRKYRMTKNKLRKLIEATGKHQRFN